MWGELELSTSMSCSFFTALFFSSPQLILVSPTCLDLYPSAIIIRLLPTSFINMSMYNTPLDLVKLRNIKQGQAVFVIAAGPSVSQYKKVHQLIRISFTCEYRYHQTIFFLC